MRAARCNVPRAGNRAVGIYQAAVAQKCPTCLARVSPSYRVSVFCALERHLHKKRHLPVHTDIEQMNQLSQPRILCIR